MEIRKHPITSFATNKDGSLIYNLNTGNRINPSTCKAGYLKIGTKACSSGSVHQLVYECWVGLVPKGLQVNHKDGVKSNNNLTNLEVVTPKENTQHAHRTGLVKKRFGDQNPMSKVSEEEVLRMYEMFQQGLCNECVAKETELHERYVSLVRHGKRWPHIYKGPFPKSRKYGCQCRLATTIETTH